MTADIINLRRARKDKARVQKERKAAENRVTFGRSRAQREHDATAAELSRKSLDAHKIDDEGEA